jgi:hypothetical protein
MSHTDAAPITASRLSTRGFAVALLAMLLTACPTETKLPTVTLAGVAAVTTETTLMLTAIATPAMGSGFNGVGPAIIKVELYDGTKKLDEKTIEPYLFEVKLTSGDNGKKQFKARAYDQAGAVGESNTVTVDVNIAVPDITPPTVISVDPPNGATGVTNDKMITVTFSEPMNQQATQAAFQSVDLPSNAVTFAWSTDGKVMTIKPNIPLEYKSVSSPSDVPRIYGYSMTSTATDLAGNKLILLNSSFSTLKQVMTTLESIDTLTGSLSGGSTSFICSEICIGETENNIGIRGFISFDLSSIPSSVKTFDILKADMKLSSSRVPSNYYPLGLCDRNNRNYTCFLIESISYADLQQSTYDARINSTVYADKFYCEILCIIQFPKDGLNTVDSLKSVQDDWENRTLRSKKSQFRYRMPLQTDGNNTLNYVKIIKNDTNFKPKLEITYLIP